MLYRPDMNVAPDGEFILVLDKLCQCRNLVASAVNRGRGIRSRLSRYITPVKHYMEQGSRHNVQIPVERGDVKEIRRVQRYVWDLPCCHRCGQSGGGW